METEEVSLVDPIDGPGVGHGEVLDDRRRWWRTMLAITALGVAVRLAFTIFVTRFDQPAGDQLFYSAQALTNADGRWFEQPFDRGAPAADHPPLTALILTPVSWLAERWPGLEISAVTLQRLFMAVLGSAGVVLMGLIGRIVDGPRTGLIAAGLTAVYANIWVNDGLLMAETPTFLVVAGVILMALHYRRRANARSALALGVLSGLAALSRPELIAVLPLIVILVWSTRSQSIVMGRDRRMASQGALVIAAWTMVVMPWVLWNNTRFEAPVFLSTNDGLTLAGGHCDRTYYDDLGGWDIWCAYATVIPDGEDAAQASQRMRQDGLDYWRDNIDRYPVVAGARLLRVLSLGYLGANAEAALAEGRPLWVSHLGTAQFWLLVPLAIFGWRRSTGRADRWILTAALPVVVMVALVANAYVRFRLPAEIGIVALAAIGLRVSLTGLEWSRLGRGVRVRSTSDNA